MKAAAVVLLALSTSLAALVPAVAIEPETRDAIVLHNRVWEGFTYVENFVPSNVEEVALLAGSDNAVLYVETLEYFWPLSREVYVAFDSKREELTGSILITQAGRPVSEIAADVYSIVYPEGAHRGDARMVWGDEAVGAYRDFLRAMADYNRAYAEAQRDKARYHEELRAAAETRLKGGETSAVAPPLLAPDPVRGSVTEPRPGYRVSLPAGAYDMALIRDGVPVPGTLKRLRVLSVDSSSVITADVIPEERWTRLLASNDPRDRIFVGEGATFYLALNDSGRFDEPAYLRLTKPQAAGTEGRQTWIRRKPHDLQNIDLRWAGGEWSTLPRKDYKAEQTQGRNLGYVIRPIEGSETADLSAFAITVPEGSSMGRAEIRIPSGPGPGEAGWTREIVVVRPTSPALVWGAAFAPAAFGVGLVLFWRGRSRQSQRIERGAQ